MSEHTVQSVSVEEIEPTFGSSSIDLISRPLGSRLLGCSDEWFADALNLTTPTPPVRKAGVYVYAGAWFDGWETRRHNPNPFDWVIIRLGVASGTVQGVEIDTAFFNGNEAPAIMVDGLFDPDANDEAILQKGDVRQDDVNSPWTLLVPRVDCGPSQRQAWTIHGPASTKPITHVRLLMLPDGGIARFRLYGTAIPVFPALQSTIFDLAAAVMGGRAISCSDQHFGRKENLILPGRGIDMGDGWETARSRHPGHKDWTIIRLGAVGTVEQVIIDTAHFRGNYPQAASVLGILWKGEDEPGSEESGWIEIVGKTPCKADQKHYYLVPDSPEVSHVQLVIYPDGGVKRIRILGRRVGEPQP